MIRLEKKIFFSLFALVLLLPKLCPAVEADALVAAAMERTAHSVRYDGRYFSIPYPGGDVPPDAGVCTDVVIRAYRAVGVDLQERVHLDMQAHFDVHPSEITGHYRYLPE